MIRNLSLYPVSAILPTWAGTLKQFSTPITSMSDVMDGLFVPNISVDHIPVVRSHPSRDKRLWTCT